MSDSIQSSDYVPGVSGWKIDGNGRLELNDGNRRVIAKMLMVTTAGPGMTNDQAQASITESLRAEVAAGCSEEKSDTPFAVKGDQVILTQAFIDAGKISPVLGVRTSVNAAGQTVFAGIGAGLCCMCEGGDTSTPGDKEVKAEVKTDFTGDFTNSSDKLCAAISETELSKALAARIGHEVTARACADTQLFARVGTLEGHAVSLGENLDRLIDCVSQLVREKPAR